MAGGKGTRIASVDPTIPKPMLLVCGKPILEHQIACLARQGITDITLVTGHLGQIIEEHFRDTDKLDLPVNLKLSTYSETIPLGTAGALWFLKDSLPEDFLLINGDLIFDIDFERFIHAHQANSGEVTILTHSNDHPYDSGVIVSDEENRIQQWMHKEDERLWYRNRVNSGVHILSPKIFDSFPNPGEKADLDRDILKPLIASGGLYAYYSTEYVKDAGTPERLCDVEADIQTGKVESRNLSRKQKAVFLDRDGTINRYVGFLRNIDDFELLDGAAEAIRRMNRIGYLVIVVTNQPIIARGEVDWEQLREIHNKMETLLGEKGAYVDDIFICPHHPDQGFERERPEYKMDCDCRKPKSGLLLQAAARYNIDLSQSWMVGDRESDAAAGKNAGCKSVILGSECKDLREFTDTRL